MSEPSACTDAGSPSTDGQADVRRWLPLTPGVSEEVLARVLAAMPDGLDPAEIVGWLSTPNPNLIVDEHIATVGQFLAAAGDPEVVTLLASQMDDW